MALNTRIVVPQFKTLQEANAWIIRFIARYEEEKLNYLLKNTSNHSIMLLSSGGKTYEVKVNDAGTLTTTQVG